MSIELNARNNASNSSKQIGMIVSAFQRYTSKLSFKHNQLIDHILKARKGAVSLISTHYMLRTLSNKAGEKAKKKELLNSILNQRKLASDKLVNWFKCAFYQKKIRAILNKREKCYTIESSIADAKEFYLQIISNGGPLKEYKAEHCPILNITAFYIPRSDIHSLIVKVHFITNGVMILDPKFGTGSDDDFTFYNQINFKKIINTENNEKEEKKKLISLMCINNTTASSSFGFKASKSISSSDLHKLNYGLSKYNKKFQSMAYLGLQVKSILKQRPAKRVSSTKRIAFGVVDYSY